MNNMNDELKCTIGPIVKSWPTGLNFNHLLRSSIRCSVYFVIKTAPGCEADVDGLVKALAQQIHIELLGDEDDDALSRVFD